MNEKDAVNTQKATVSHVGHLRVYLEHNSLPILEEVLNADLPKILFDFYTGVEPLKGGIYSVQTLKCIRAGLNRYFRKARGIDIIKDTQFVQTNEMFKSVAVKAQKEGKGIFNSTKPIAQDDLQKITDYFTVNHIVSPNPKVLQRTLLFYIIYYFCRRGSENLYNTEKDWFKLFTDYNGTEYVYQIRDEKDKNHGPEYMTPTNEAKMYSIPGNYEFL